METGGGSSTETTFERVVDFLNDAALETDTEKKVNLLHQVQELIVHKEPNLLDNFLDEMLAFQSDQEAEVRKLIAGFIEDALSSDEETIPKILTSLMMLLSDGAVSVSKRAILTAGTVFAKTFKWIATSRNVSDIMKECWDFVNKMKKSICDRIGSENEGVKAHIIRYIESVIVCLSKQSPQSSTAQQSADTSAGEKQEAGGAEKLDLSLDLIADQHPLLKAKKLEDEGRRLFEMLVHFTSSESISSQTLMAIMSSVTSIAVQRPAFMLAAVELLEALHVDLPPKLVKSQVSSVRKSLKMQLMRLAKRELTADLAHRIGTLLSDLGATQAEVMRLMPKPQLAGTASGGQGASSKRKLSAVGSGVEPEAKLARQPVAIPLQSQQDDDDVDDLAPSSGPSSSHAMTFVDKLAEELMPKLNLQNVTDLVLMQMVHLPDAMPAAFQATYTPISAAGTPAQVQHMARMLSAQVLQSAVGRAYIASTGGSELKPGEAEEAEKQVISTVIGGALSGPKPDTQVELPKLGMRQPQKMARHYKLAEMTPTVVSKEILCQTSLSCIKRTLSAERHMSKTKLHSAWIKLVSCLASMFGTDYKEIVYDFVCEDLRGRFELTISWLTHEYAVGRGYLATFSGTSGNNGGFNPGLAVYDEWLTKVLVAVYQKTSPKLGLFGQLLLQSPSLTPGALNVLRLYCQDENCSYLGMAVLCELATDRLAERARLLPILLDFSLYEKAEVRSNALRELRKMYTKFEGETRQTIEEFAITSLRHLRSPQPPEDFFGCHRGRVEVVNSWSEDLQKTACSLFLTLLPVNQNLLHTLAEAYVATHAELKKPLLKLLDPAIKQMGMNSPALLDFISKGPRGAETLIARIVHILTADGQQCPSPELVARVYALYQTRVDDVRFLIPVIPGLSKKEIFSILPDVIKLNPVVVKEVFSRIIGKSASNQPQGQTPLPAPCSPAELLVELHSLDPTKVDLKLVIKSVNLLLADKQHYSQEVMAVVLQQLIDLQPLPVLLMRTLLQSLAMYPRLIGLSMNIMHRLIQKHVWKYPRLWDGFVRCCQQTKPRSFEVLLQLPPAQLKNVVFVAAPDLRAPLLEHVSSLPEGQLAQIPKTTLYALESVGNVPDTTDEQSQPGGQTTTEQAQPQQQTDPIKEEEAAAPMETTS